MIFIFILFFLGGGEKHKGTSLFELPNKIQFTLFNDFSLLGDHFSRLQPFGGRNKGRIRPENPWRGSNHIVLACLGRRVWKDFHLAMLQTLLLFDTDYQVKTLQICSITYTLSGQGLPYSRWWSRRGRSIWIQHQKHSFPNKFCLEIWGTVQVL